METKELDYTELMVVTLSRSVWLPKATDKDVNKEVYQKHGIDERAGKWEKYLLAREAIKTYSVIANEIYRWHRENTMAHPDRGLALITIPHLEKVYKPKMDEYIPKFWEAVKTFKENYEFYKQQAKENDLKGTYKESDYPSLAELDSKFDISVSYRPYPSSSHLVGKMKAELYKEVKALLDKDNETVKATFMQDLWDRTYKVVAHLIERLQNSDNVFRDSLTGNVKELCETLKTLNPNGDGQLERMRKEIEDKLSNFDPDYLRVNRKMRSEATATAEKILSEIDTQRRKIRI